MSQRPSRAVRRRASRSPRGRLRALGRRRAVARGPADASSSAAAASARWRSRSAGPARTCIPAAMAARWPTRSRRWSQLLAGLHDARRLGGGGGLLRRARSRQRRRGAPPSRAIPFDEAAYLAEVGASEGAGEAGYTLLQRNWIRPTLEFNGIVGGYTGAGKKTVIPHAAPAKITCRLVPGQDPDRIVELIAAHLKRHAPQGVRVRRAPRDGRHAGLRRAGATTRGWRSRRTCWKACSAGGRCGCAWAPRSRSARSSSACSGSTPCSSRSPPWTRTTTRPTSSSGCRATNQGMVAWARYLRRLGA